MSSSKKSLRSSTGVAIVVMSFHAPPVVARASMTTSNLLRHARICWGTDAVEAATVTKDLEAAREVLGTTKLRDGSILAEFQWLSKDKVTYRHTQHTTSEARYVPF